MAKREHFEVGNQVRLRNDDGSGTLYEITSIAANGLGCMIREYTGKPPFYTEQYFDTSLLKHAVSDAMLKAFSFGPLKAVRPTKPAGR